MNKILLFIGLTLIERSVVAEVVPCETLFKAWPAIAADFGADFALNERCEGISGRFATAAYLLKTHFPSYYKEVDAEISTTSLGQEAFFAAWAVTSTRKMVLHPSYASHSLIFSLSTLVHESTHMDRRVPLHVVCTRGYYKGKPGVCDELMTGRKEHGSYNMEIAFLGEIAEFTFKQGVFKKSEIASRIGNLLEHNFNIVDEAVERKYKAIVQRLTEPEDELTQILREIKELREQQERRRQLR